MNADQKFESLNLILPPPPEPKGVYKPSLIVGDMLYVSGHGPFREDHSLIIGQVGNDMSLEEGYLAAKQVGLAILATIKAAVGSLDRIERVVKILGMVNAHSSFEQHPKVINGCSDLFAEIWGLEKGVGVRSAVGMGTLPENIAVEIEAQFLLKN